MDIEKELEGLEPEVQEKVKAALKGALEKKDADLNNVVNELKETRKTKAEIEAERDALKAKTAQPPADPQNVEAVVTKIFEEKEKRQALGNREAAEAKFKSLHKEFHPDNDPGGVKFAAIQQKAARFNSSGLSKEEEFFALLDDAYTLINPERKVSQAKDYNPYAASPSQIGSEPKSKSADQLSATEADLIRRMGWTEERYLKVKKSRPDYVNGLLRHLE